MRMRRISSPLLHVGISAKAALNVIRPSPASPGEDGPSPTSAKVRWISSARNTPSPLKRPSTPLPPKPTNARNSAMPENASTMLQNRLLAALLKNATATVIHLKEKLHSFQTRVPPLLSGPYLSQLTAITLELIALEAS